MDIWPEDGPKGFAARVVHRFCVDTKHPEVATWQEVRLSMKGKPTTEKLDILWAWYKKNEDSEGNGAYAAYVQVYNYLGALRRGGQLGSNNEVRKHL